jgi:predicted  nucleic acid-binding Zn-ribbon protein
LILLFCIAAVAASEVGRLQKEVEAGNAALKQLDEEALAVMNKQEELGTRLTAAQEVLTEVQRRKEEKEKHVSVATASTC